LAEAEAQKVKWLASAEAERIQLTGDAEAGKTLAIGKSSAEAYRLAVEAMGGNNFTQLKITEAIGKEKIKIIPEILISGNGDSTNGGISGLLGLKLLEEINKRYTTPVKDEGNQENSK
jgi:uncharacterized membrane protein YqiK